MKIPNEFGFPLIAKETMKVTELTILLKIADEIF